MGVHAEREMLHGLTSIPEAHCYLRTCRGVIDVTMPDGPPTGIERRVLHEEVIPPDGIGAYKVSVHRRVLEEWSGAEGRADLGLHGLWAVREACIVSLSVPTVES